MLSPGIIVDLVGSLLITGLGLFMALLRPATRRNLYFAVFGLTFGGQFVMTSILRVATDAEVITAATGPFWFHAVRAGLRILAAASLVGVAFVLPDAFKRHERRWAVLAGVLALTVFGLVVTFKTTLGTLGDTGGAAPLVGEVALDAVVAAHIFTLAGLAIRFAMVSEHARTLRRQAGHMAAALGLYPGFIAGAGLYTGDSPLSGEAVHLAVGIVLFVAIVALVVAWLGAVRGPDGHLARNIALVTLAAPLLGMVYYLLYDAAIVRSGGHGFVRTIGFVILTYAIVKHQLLGIDLKVRFAVKHSTLAGIFVAVAFVMSEIAQEIFGEVTQSAYYGIAATGLLVFAIAPLQRFADRVSRRAVPVADAGATDEVLAFYKQQVVIAWMDGAMTRREALILHNLRGMLGINDEVADRLEREAMAPQRRKRGKAAK